MSQRDHSRIVSAALFAVFIAAIATGLYVAISERPFGLEMTEKTLTVWVHSLGSWGGLGIIALMIVHSFIPFPAEFVTFIAGHIFGLFWGTVFAWTGAMLGACMAFALSRYCGREFIVSFLPATAQQRLSAWSEERTATAFLVARFMPIIAFNLINYAAGLTKISWWTFVWTTGLGILPLTVVFVYLGEHMRAAAWTDWAMLAGGAVILTFAIRAGQRLWQASHNDPPA